MAVYTDVGFEDLEGLLAGYDIGVPLTFKGIAEGVENSNFYLQTDRGAFILTLYEKRVRTDDLPFFLGLMEHLAAAGMSCPQPVRDSRRARNPSCSRAGPARSSPFSTAFRCAGPKPAHCAAAGRGPGANCMQAGRGFRPHPRQCAGS